MCNGGVGEVKSTTQGSKLSVIWELRIMYLLKITHKNNLIYK